MLRTRVALVLSLLVATSLTATTSGQEDPAAPADPAAGAPPIEKPIERVIYVPFRDLREALEKVDRTIFLPYAEYVELVRRAEADRRRRLDGPEAVITASRYIATVEEDHVRIAATFEIEALEEPWAEVPLHFGGAAVGRISTAEGQPEVLLRGTGAGRYAFVLPKKGPHTVELELLARVRSSPEGRGFAVPIPSVGITSLEFTVPDPDQEVTIGADTVVIPVEEAAAGSTQVKADLGATPQLSVRWSPRAGLKPDMDLLASVESALQVSFADRLVNTRATLSYRVLRGELATARIAVPKGHRVIDVASPDVELEGWTTAEEENRNVVTAELLSPARKPFTIEVRTEGPLGDGAQAIAGLAADGTAHGIHALDVVRESGRLVVVPDRESNLVVENSTGLVRVEASDVPVELRFARGRFFRFFDPRFTLSVELQPIEPRIVVDTRATIAFEEARIETRTTFNETIERAGVFDRSYEIPAGQEIVEVGGPQYRDHTFDAGSRILRVTLLERFLGTHVISVSTRVDFDAASKQDALALSLPKPLDVDRETGRLDVFAIAGVAVRTDEARLSGLVPEATAARATLGDASVVSSWSFNKRPFELVVGTVRRPTRLSATVATTLDVKREIARVRSRIDYRIEYAGVNELRFEVPRTVAEGLAVTDGRGEPVDWRPGESENGWTPIRVRLDGKTVGPFALLVEYDLAPGGKAIPEPAPEPDPAAPVPVDDAADGAGDDAEEDAADDDEADPAEEAGADAEEPAGDDPAEEAAGKDEPAAPPQPANDGEGVSATAPAADPPGDRFVLQPLRVLGLGTGANAVPLAEVRGEIAVTRERVLSVVGRVTGTDVEAIDVREFAFHGADDAALAYRYVTQVAALSVWAAVHEIEEVVETVVSRALVEVVASRDDRASYRCRYRLVSSERQRLAIQLPIGAEVLGVFVDDPAATCDGAVMSNGSCPPVAVDLEQDATTAPAEGFEAFSISIARRAASDQPFHLVLLFRQPLEPKPFVTRGGRLQLALPRIGGDGVPVQRLRTVVWVPEEFSLVGTPERFVNESQLWLRESLLEPVEVVTDLDDVEAWIGGDSVGLFEFPTEGRAYMYSSVGGADRITVQWWHMPFVTWIVSLAIAVMAFLLRNTSWENKIAIVVLSAFALAAYALADRDTALHLLLAARFGLLALAVLWIVHGLLTIPEAYRVWRNPGRPRPLGQPIAVVSPPPKGPRG